jgi:hypothetical protein
MHRSHLISARIEKANFCWGGATAINRATFERLGIREKWRGTLSDDFTVTRALHEAGLDIHFVPHALTPSIEDCSWRELFEFTTRQMKITRVYSPNLWVLSFIGSGLFATTMIASLLIIIFSQKNDVPVAGRAVHSHCCHGFQHRQVGGATESSPTRDAGTRAKTSPADSSANDTVVSYAVRLSDQLRRRLVVTPDRMARDDL